MEALNYPLSNIQLDLLKLFSRNIEEQDLKEIKKLIVKYLAERLADKANKVWEQKSWTDADMDKLLNTHMKTPYKK